VYKTSFLHRPDDYIGLIPSPPHVPLTFYTKIAPMCTLNAFFSENGKLFANAQGRNEGGQGGTILWAPNHCGAPKSPDNVTSTFFNGVHLLPKDRFEHGGAKFASCPGPHL